MNQPTTPNTVEDFLPLPEPLEIEWPELHPQALGCGVEDRNITDRYEAAAYGWQDGVDKAASCVPDDIYDGDQMRAYVLADRAQRSTATQAAQPTEQGAVIASISALVGAIEYNDTITASGIRQVYKTELRIARDFIDAAILANQSQKGD